MPPQILSHHLHICFTRLQFLAARKLSMLWINDIKKSMAVKYQ